MGTGWTGERLDGVVVACIHTVYTYNCSRVEPLNRPRKYDEWPSWPSRGINGQAKYCSNPHIGFDLRKDIVPIRDNNLATNVMPQLDL